MVFPSGSGELSESTRIRELLEVWQDGASKPAVFPLFAERTLIGSGSQAQVVLSHPSVAPVHAQLVRSSLGRFRVQALSGASGVFVGGLAVVDRMLDVGEDARIGEFTLRVRKRSSDEYRFVLPAFERGSAQSGSAAIPTRLAIDGDHLSSLIQLGRMLAGTAGGRTRMQLVCDCLISPPHFARSAAVLRITEGADVEVLRGATASGTPDELAVPGSLVERLLATRGPVMELNEGLAVMACPLDLEEAHVDALFATFPPSHATKEWLSLVTLAAESHQQAELLWEMRTHVRASVRVERELEMAREIQEGLIPRALQFRGLLRGVDVALGFEPCRWVGGDYVDAVALQDGRILMTVADVCGMGMQAAMVASAVHCAIHVIAAYTNSIPELLERINLHLCNYLPSHSFVTMVCAALDLASGSLEYASAGHPPAIVLQPGGPVDLLHYGDNPPLGVMDTRIVARTTVLGIGETLILYTDGLTELENDNHEQLGTVHLAEILSNIMAHNPRATAEETRSGLMSALRAFRGSVPPTDDSTFLVARRCGNPGSPPRHSGRA